MGEIPQERLVPRYAPKDRIEIDWIVDGPPTGRQRRQPTKITVRATIVDVSVSGMLFEVPLESPARIGDLVTIESDGNPAVVQVTHVSTDAGETHQLVGVQIAQMSAGFKRDLNAVVADLRGDRGGLVEFWETR